MPVTNIKTIEQSWTPVEITLTVSSRDELAVFVSLLGSTHCIAAELKAIGHDRLNHLSESQIEKIIDDMIDVESWKNLSTLTEENSDV